MCVSVTDTYKFESVFYQIIKIFLCLFLFLDLQNEHFTFESAILAKTAVAVVAIATIASIAII